MGSLPPIAGRLAEAEISLREGPNPQPELPEQPHQFPAASSRPGDGRGWIRSHAFGRLEVWSDAVVFSPSRVSARITRAGNFTHTDRAMTMTVIGLAAPWSNTSICLHEGNRELRVTVPGFVRHHLRWELERSQFVVTEHRAWRRASGPAR